MKIKKYFNADIFLQLFIILIPILLMWDLALISKYTDKSSLLYIIIMSVVLNVSFIVLLLGFIKTNTNKISIKSFFINYYPILIIFAIMMLAFSTAINGWLNLDGFIYYKALRRMKYWNFIGIDNFMMAGHMAQGYSIFLIIGEFIFPDMVLGARIMHCIIALITLFAFYDILQITIKNVSKIELTLYTGIYAFSPLFLGLLSEINTDFPILCFFTWMIWASLRKKHLLQFACAMLLCFSKETGCILYGFFIIGTVIARIITNRKEKFLPFLKKVISLDIVLLTIVGCLWIFNYVTYSGSSWGNGTTVSSTAISTEGYKLNSVTFYPEYIICKLKQMIFINFNWIPYFLILLLICTCLFYGKKYIKKHLNISLELFFATIASYVGFVIYNSLYITWIHYRYLMPFVFFISLGTAFSIACCFQKKIYKYIISVLIIVLFFVSNFYTIDPISKKLFMTQNTGNGEILIPSNMTSVSSDRAILNNIDNYSLAKFNNSSLYNYQNVYLGLCIDKCLDTIQYNGASLIVLPCEYRDEYGSKLSIFGVNLEGINDYYYNIKTKHLNISCANDISEMQDDPDYIKLNLIFAKSMSDISQDTLNKYNNVYYFELPFMKEFNHKAFLGNHKIIESTTVQYFSWKWNVDKIK